MFVGFHAPICSERGTFSDMIVMRWHICKRGTFFICMLTTAWTFSFKNGAVWAFAAYVSELHRVEGKFIRKGASCKVNPCQHECNAINGARYIVKRQIR